jgi:ribosomal protein S18 acetylase RimI-like enzyme
MAPYARAVFAIRPATLDDLPRVLAWTRALNAVESIVIEDGPLETATRHLLGSPELGGVWVITRDGAAIGQAVVTYGYDLEFAGRDSFLTELWIDPEHRGNGAATEALRLLAGELRDRGVHALHLQVRPDNPAYRLYARAGFTASPRTVMTRRL